MGLKSIQFICFGPRAGHEQTCLWPRELKGQKTKAPKNRRMGSDLNNSNDNDENLLLPFLSNT